MPSIGESIARRRVFWFLVLLVVGPTLGLAGYVLAGIKYQQDAAEARLRERSLLQARELESAVVARLAEEDAAVRRTLQDLPDDEVAGAVAQLTTGIISGAWTLDDPFAPEMVAGVAERLSPSTPLTFLDDNGDTIAISRVREGLVVAYRVPAAAIDALVLPEVVGRRFPNELAQYHLVGAGKDRSGAPVSFEALRRDLTARLAADEPIVERAMAPPFDHWRIVVTAGPTESGHERRVIWIVVLLVGAVVSGVWALGRAVVQQARLSRLQTDFVSNVSHELRTPLTSIRMFIETLQSGRVTDPEKVRECLEIIATESDRLTRKIERVLTWARMEAGRHVYDMEPRRPAELVVRALAAFRATDLAGETHLEVEVPRDLPPVLADADAIAEALLNLMSNARKYGGDGVHIKVSGHVDGRWVVLAVSDDGPGIPLPDRSRVFEKFYRADSLLSRRTQGSGLGLAIVRAIVLAHKGKVEVDSEGGRGARFTIRLKKLK